MTFIISKSFLYGIIFSIKVLETENLFKVSKEFSHNSIHLLNCSSNNLKLIFVTSLF